MAQTGYTPIQLYYSTTAAAVPTNTNLANGELAINITDGKLYYKDNTGTVKLLTSTGSEISPITNNGVVYVNGSGQATSGSALTFDGTNFATTGNIDSGSAKNIALNATSSSDTNRLQWKYQGTAYAWIERINSNGDMAFTVQSAEGMRLTSTGLGIGTSSPTKALQVGSGSITDSTFSGISVQHPYNPGINLVAPASTAVKTWINFGTDSNSSIGRINYDLVSNYLSFNTNAAERMRIDSSGQVQIGNGLTGALSTLTIASTNGSAPSNTNGTGALRLRSTATASVGVGPSIVFEGQTGNSTTNFGFAGIQGFKASATASDYSGALAFYVQNSGGSTALTEQMRLDASGNLGLGVTPSAWDSAFKAFQLNTTGAIASTSNRTFVGQNWYDSASGGKFIGTGYALRYDQLGSNGQHQWYTSTASGTAGTAISFTQAMTLNASGNLGVGVTSPASKLDIFPTFSGSTGTTLGDTAYADIYARSGGYLNQYGQICFGYTGNYATAAIGFLPTLASGNTKGDLVFATRDVTTDTAPTERFRIASNGAWGLAGANYGTAGQVLTSNGSGAAPSWQAGGSGSSQWTTSGTQIYYNTGNVGIGTASPDTYADGGKNLTILSSSSSTRAQLAIVGTQSTANEILGRINFTNTNSTNTAYRVALIDGIRGSDNNSGYLTFSTGYTTSPSERMRIDENGRVGIGTTSPNVKLDVLSGTANTSGDTITLQTASVTGADLAFSNHAGILNVATNTTPTTNVGGSIGFAGAWSGTSQAGYALIKGAKENSSTNYASYLAFYTRPDGAAMSERMRLNSTGSLLVGTSSQLATNLLHTVTKQQIPVSNSTAWADQMSPLVVYGNFGDGSNDQGVSSALTVVGWSSLAGNVGAIMRGWWSQSGAGLSTPTLKFQIAHTGNVTNLNNSYGSLSDLRLKENITDATPKLENLNKLRVVNFNLIEDPNKCKQIGLIAQEVEQVFPALVETDGEGTKSVKYSVLVPMLVKAMQEQQAIIESLKARLDAANL